MCPTSNKPEDLRTWWCSATAKRASRPAVGQPSVPSHSPLSSCCSGSLTRPTRNGALVTLHYRPAVAERHIVARKAGHLGLVGRVDVQRMQRRLQEGLRVGRRAVSARPRVEASSLGSGARQAALGSRGGEGRGSSGTRRTGGAHLWGRGGGRSQAPAGEGDSASEGRDSHNRRWRRGE